MSLEWILFGLRLLAALVLYAFLSVAFYLIWRQLRQVQPQTSSVSLGRVDQLRVVAAVEGRAWQVGQTLPLTTATVLGSGSDQAFMVNSADFLSGHARICRRVDRWWLEKLDTPVEITLNNRPLAETCPLSQGDVIAVGETHFRLELQTNPSK